MFHRLEEKKPDLSSLTVKEINEYLQTFIKDTLQNGIKQKLNPDAKALAQPNSAASATLFQPTFTKDFAISYLRISHWVYPKYTRDKTLQDIFIVCNDLASWQALHDYLKNTHDIQSTTTIDYNKEGSHGLPTRGATMSSDYYIGPALTIAIRNKDVGKILQHFGVDIKSYQDLMEKADQVAKTKSCYSFCKWIGCS